MKNKFLNFLDHVKGIRYHWKDYRAKRITWKEFKDFIIYY